MNLNRRSLYATWPVLNLASRDSRSYLNAIAKKRMGATTMRKPVLNDLNVGLK